MTQYLKYKGYQGTIEPQIDDGTLFGKVAFIRDLITYGADTLPKLIEEFQQSVDDYLKDCEELGKTPDKPFKGSLNVRVGEELHKAMAIAILEAPLNHTRPKSINAFICEAIEEKLSRERSKGISTDTIN
ncbi:type II toxin-antitoxin system HicB family antitoxin [Endozoicomonas sp. ALD040]|uniref:type II toxin-antitoxin system HicB family antitoxin n=1 Tax=unclassified Endozoicomonas TaxID=2644528 RepID=UPI003BAE5DA6